MDMEIIDKVRIEVAMDDAGEPVSATHVHSNGDVEVYTGMDPIAPPYVKVAMNTSDKEITITVNDEVIFTQAIGEAR